MNYTIYLENMVLFDKLESKIKFNKIKGELKEKKKELHLLFMMIYLMQKMHTNVYLDLMLEEGKFLNLYQK
jgi:hypothetical protein